MHMYVTRGIIYFSNSEYIQHKPTTWVVTNAATASFSSFLINILKYLHILHTDTYIWMHIHISRYTLYIVRQYILKPEVGSSKYILIGHTSLSTLSIGNMKFYLERSWKGTCRNNNEPNSI